MDAVLLVQVPMCGFDLQQPMLAVDEDEPVHRWLPLFVKQLA